MTPGDFDLISTFHGAQNVFFYAYLLKNRLWAPMHKKCMSGIMGGQNQEKATKGHQVQICKKCTFELLHVCTDRSILDITGPKKQQSIDYRNFFL